MSFELSTASLVHYASHTKSHMTYIFICSSLKLLYIGFGYECFFLWKGQTLHTYHQCKALLIKKQAGEFVKVIEILLMWGGKAWQFAEKKKKWPPNILGEKMGRPLSCDYGRIFLLPSATWGCLRHPCTETGWDTPTPSSLVHAGAHIRLCQRHTKLC